MGGERFSETLNEEAVAERARARMGLPSIEMTAQQFEETGWLFTTEEEVRYAKDAIDNAVHDWHDMMEDWSGTHGYHVEIDELSTFPPGEHPSQRGRMFVDVTLADVADKTVANCAIRVMDGDGLVARGGVYGGRAFLGEVREADTSITNHYAPSTKLIAGYSPLIRGESDAYRDLYERTEAVLEEYGRITERHPDSAVVDDW